MRHLTYNTIKKISGIYPNILTYRNFVETGTYKGETVFPLAKIFKNLYTIDINSNAFNYCRNFAIKNNIKNIKFYLGDSSKVLKDIIPILDGPAIYFLDAHVTDNGSGFTGKGAKDVPLLEELVLINTIEQDECVIVIDDMRLFGIGRGALTANADWSEINLDAVLGCFTEGRVIRHFPDPDFKPSSGVAKNGLKNDRYILVLGRRLS